MANGITFWQLAGAGISATLVGLALIAIRFLVMDPNWHFLKLRWWLILIGTLPGFLLGSTVHPAGAHSSESLAYQNSGQISYARGDYNAALKSYDQAVRLDPQQPTSYRGRALAELAKGDNKGAFNDFSQAIQPDPQDATAYYYRGLLRLADANPTRAEALNAQIADVHQASQFDPSLA